MRWSYFLQQKLKIALLLCIILIAVFVNNRIECGNVSRLGSSFTSVYEDRLMVEHYIFQLSNHLHNKKHTLSEFEPHEAVQPLPYLEEINADIEVLLHNYGETMLTDAEDSLFLLFQKELLALEKSESAHFSESLKRDPQLSQHYANSFTLLKALSAIQIEEGKSLYENSKRVVVSNESTAQFELAIIIVLGLIILGLIFESKKVSPGNEQKFRLN